LKGTVEFQRDAITAHPGATTDIRAVMARRIGIGRRSGEIGCSEGKDEG
jgi:hypothetical protein